MSTSSPHSGDFELRIGTSDGTLVVAPHGDLDIASIPQLADALVTNAAKDVVIDLRGVEFIDSSGIAGLLEAWRRAAEAGGRLRCVAGPPQVRRVFALVELDRTLEWTEAPTHVDWIAAPR